MNLFDSHAHFDKPVSQKRLAPWLEAAAEAGVSRMLAVGGRPDANRLTLKLAKEHDDIIRASAGWDRDETGKDHDAKELEEQLSDPLTVALGEIGLDYFYQPETAPAQRLLLEDQLERARNHQLPVIIHTREADEDTLAILSDHARIWKGNADRIGVIHCFTREKPLATKLLDLGFMISFSGILSFNNAEPLRAVAKALPLDRLLIETDSPYLAPVPHRGQANQPAFVAAVADCLATQLELTPEEVAAATYKNACTLFGWP